MKVTQREQETAQNRLASSRHTIRQMTTFRHFFEAFRLFITSDQTYPRSGSRSSVAVIAMVDESVNKRDNRCLHLCALCRQQSQRHTSNAMKSLLRAADAIGTCSDCDTELGEVVRMGSSLMPNYLLNSQERSEE